jgi:arsenite-transporting ATPase
MSTAHLTDAPAGRFTFVVGKGGTGKSTTASALALGWSEAGIAIHLLSTDPAPSFADIFGLPRDGAIHVSSCSSTLQIEELNADGVANDFVERVRGALEQLIEQGTYLDRDDVERLTHLTLPGVDELAGALRIAELGRGNAQVVVDTAPTGHTLRLLDSALLIDSWANVFSTMSDKVATIALTMVRARVTLPAEDAVQEMRDTADAFRIALSTAEFVVTTRAGAVVEAETERLIAALKDRNLRIRALVDVAASDDRTDSLCDVGIPVVRVPRLDPHGCAGLRAWLSAAQEATHVAAHETRTGAAQGLPLVTADAENASAHRIDAGVAAASDDANETGCATWLTSHTQKLFWFAGKGGVGKSTCAAAAALHLARTRNVLLCSTDPAGSLRDVLQLNRPADGEAVTRGLRALQVDAAADLDAWRARYRVDAEHVFEHLGVGGSATLDRNIMSAIWDAVPPGIDELFALSEILDTADTSETIVVDAAPTGHFLRLIEAPGMALEWTHAILRILLKYGVAGALDGFSERVLAFARQLRHLSAMLVDPESCGVWLVRTDESIVQAQTERLQTSLSKAHINVVATIVNRAPNATTANAVAAKPGAARVFAPLMATPPVGPASLQEFFAQWKCV